MTIQNVIEFGKRNDACVSAMRWLITQTDAEQAWLTCDRPDWMIWYATRRGVDHKTLVRIACDCARTALRFVPEGEDRPRLCIETTEAWIEGNATIDEVRKARNGAADAAAAAYAAYAAYADADADADAAAAAAAYAADADADADAAAAAAADAAYAAYAADAYAAYAADAYADADARRNANIQMCEIVRRHISYQDVAL